ncbi:MAG: ATP-binding protein [marine benthic group bacterium]|nr:ATP-binding protein [Gemmatimonadota bacterium]
MNSDPYKPAEFRKGVRQGTPPTLGRRLLWGLLILLFVALFTVAVTVYIVFRLSLPLGVSALVLAVVTVGDIMLLGLFARSRLRELVLEPIDAMVDGAERIAAGDRLHRLPDVHTAELERLSSAVNSMAEGLLENQETLAANVRSLNATNRELSEARTRLVRAEKLASIGRLSAGVAHEIGNPLGAILGYLEVGRRRGEGSEWLQGIDYETKRIDRIVRGLLEYARPKEASARAVDFNETVRRTEEMLRLQGRFKGSQVRLALSDDLPPVQGDSSQLEQVLVNLLLNATDAIDETGGPGEIEIATRAVTVGTGDTAAPVRRSQDPEGVDYSHLRRLDQARDPGPARRLRPGDPAVELQVRDSGPGIPEDIRSRVFEPFFTTKEPGRGTGLGLAVSARLIEGMGGAIEVVPTDRGGALLRLLLPVVTGGRDE